MINAASQSVQLASAIDSIRLGLHVLGASIWVGGQFTLAALVPILRKHNPELPKIIARAFNKIGWSAWALLLITGFWNMLKIPKTGVPTNYHAVLGAKMTVVFLSGVAAYVHTRSNSRKSIAIWGSLSGLFALSAMYLGVLLAG
jgi:putative copper export protein